MIRKLLKFVGAIVVVVLVVAGGLLAWILTHWDVDYSTVAKPVIAASTDPAVIARGEYLFHAAGHCSGCHAGPSPALMSPRWTGTPPASKGGPSEALTADTAAPSKPIEKI